MIDSVLWSVDPYGHTGDEHLALLVGHPVIIARARLRLEMQEPIHPETTNLTLVPVRLGALAHWQDGLFSYFVNDDYTTLHCSDAAAAGLARAVGPNQGFLQPINLVPDHFNNFVADTGSTPVDHPYVETSGVIWVHPNQNVDLTLLIEPHTGFTPPPDCCRARTSDCAVSGSLMRWRSFRRLSASGRCWSTRSAFACRSQRIFAEPGVGTIARMRIPGRSCRLRTQRKMPCCRPIRLQE